MKRLMLFVFTVLLMALPARAQVEVVAQAKTDLEAAHVVLSGNCGAAKITNLVAWRLHYGLLRKSGGNRAVLKADGSCVNGDTTGDPDGFATDYIIDRATFYGFDILIASGEANGPNWPAPETENADRNRANLKDPLDPAAYLLGTVSVPPAPPVPAVAGVTQADLAAAVAAIEAHDDANTEKIQQQIDQAIKNAETSVKTIIEQAGGASTLLKILTLGLAK